MSRYVDWNKTKENINFLLLGRTHKNMLAEALCIGERAVQIKLQTTKNELKINDIIVLADYLGCEIEELLIFEDDKYIGPDKGWKDEWRRIEVDDECSEQVEKRIEFNNLRKKSYPIWNLAEFILYLPLISDSDLRDMSLRCYENLTYDHRDYLMSLLEYLHDSIPESDAKREADAYRDNVLRVKGVPGNNIYSFCGSNSNGAYKRMLKRYVEGREFSIWSLK